MPRNIDLSEMISNVEAVLVELSVQTDGKVINQHLAQIMPTDSKLNHSFGLMKLYTDIFMHMLVMNGVNIVGRKWVICMPALLALIAWADDDGYSPLTRLCGLLLMICLVAVIIKMDCRVKNATIA